MHPHSFRAFDNVVYYEVDAECRCNKVRKVFSDVVVVVVVVVVCANEYHPRNLPGHDPESVKTEKKTES